MPRVERPAAPARSDIVDVARAERAGPPGPRDVDDVRHHADRSGHVTGAASGDETWSERAPFEEDRVEHPRDIGQHAALVHQRGVNAQLDAAALISADGQML